MSHYPFTRYRRPEADQGAISRSKLERRRARPIVPHPTDAASAPPHPPAPPSSPETPPRGAARRSAACVASATSRGGKIRAYRPPCPPCRARPSATGSMSMTAATWWATAMTRGPERIRRWFGGREKAARSRRRAALFSVAIPCLNRYLRQAPGSSPPSHRATSPRSRRESPAPASNPGSREPSPRPLEEAPPCASRN